MITVVSQATANVVRYKRAEQTWNEQREIIKRSKIITSSKSLTKKRSEP